MFGYLVFWHSYGNRMSISIQIVLQLWQIWHHMLIDWVHMHRSGWLAFLTCFHASTSHVIGFLSLTSYHMFNSWWRYFRIKILFLILYFKYLIFRYNKLAEIKNDKMNTADGDLRGDSLAEDPVRKSFSWSFLQLQVHFCFRWL